MPRGQKRESTRRPKERAQSVVLTEVPDDDESLPNIDVEVINQRHKAFADAILEGANPSDAARVAGYHPSNAKNVMRNEDVQLMLAEARREIEDTTTLKRLDVMNIFLEAIDMARTLADPSQMINGADKLAKMMGYYAPETIKLEAESENSKLMASKFKGMSDEELYRIASGKAKVIDGEVLQ